MVHKQQAKCLSVQLCPSAGIQQHGASLSAGAKSNDICATAGAQGLTGGQGDEEREPGQLQHEGQELEDGVPRDVSNGHY